ncbi:MAG: hypothetical protein AB8F94_25890 [Saprospiraceae bacterium]
MKMLTFCFVVILISIFTSILNSKPVINFKHLGVLSAKHFAHIFYLNELGNILLIDFGILADRIQTVKVTKNGEFVKADDVSELPEDSIYELDLNSFSRGKYIIELITNTHQSITNELKIN